MFFMCFKKERRKNIGKLKCTSLSKLKPNDHFVTMISIIVLLCIGFQSIENALINFFYHCLAVHAHVDDRTGMELELTDIDNSEEAAPDDTELAMETDDIAPGGDENKDTISAAVAMTRSLKRDLRAKYGKPLIAVGLAFLRGTHPKRSKKSKHFPVFPFREWYDFIRRTSTQCVLVETHECYTSATCPRCWQRGTLEKLENDRSKLLRICSSCVEEDNLEGRQLYNYSDTVNVKGLNKDTIGAVNIAVVMFFRMLFGTHPFAFTSKCQVAAQTAVAVT